MASDIYSFGVVLWEVIKHRSCRTNFPAGLEVDWTGPSADILRGVDGVHAGALADCEHIPIPGRTTRTEAYPPGVHVPSRSLRRPTAVEVVAALKAP